MLPSHVSCYNFPGQKLYTPCRYKFSHGIHDKTCKVHITNAGSHSIIRDHRHSLCELCSHFGRACTLKYLKRFGSH